MDLDPQAVEVTQLSLYLKMLENENRTTLAARARTVCRDDEPSCRPLQDNIKCGNSLIASDFSMMPEDLVRVHAFDWPVQFPAIMKAGGFDAVVGNPPYILLQDDFRDDQQLEYFRQAYEGASYKLDTYHLFIERGIRLCRKAGRISLITPSNFLTNNHLDGLRKLILKKTQPEEIVVVEGGVFAGVSVDNAVFVSPGRPTSDRSVPHDPRRGGRERTQAEWRKQSRSAAGVGRGTRFVHVGSHHPRQRPLGQAILALSQAGRLR